MGGVKPLKGVAFDLDDTLLRDDLTISDYTRDVLYRLRRKGVLLVPASGRTCRSMLSFVNRLGCVETFISCNGAEIWSAGDSPSLIHREVFSPEAVLRILSFAEENDCYAQVYDAERYYYNRDGFYAELYAGNTVLEGVRTEDLTAFADRSCCKVLLVDHPDRIRALAADAQESFGPLASVTSSKPNYLEFNPPLATKGIALQKVFGHCGIPMSETVAFGDSLNDWSMLSVCGRGVCVRNAREELLSRCAETCLSNQEDGVARFLEEHYL